MIYLLVWENYFRNNLINNWKNAFIQKYSELNIFHIKSVLDYDLNFYNQNLLSSWFFSQKSLFIIDDFPFTTWETDQNIIKMQDYFLNIFDKVWEDNIVIFNNIWVDKRSKLYKKISTIWEIKDFNIVDENDLKQKVLSVFKDKISQNALNEIIKLKWLNFWIIVNEIQKLSILTDYIEIEHIKNITNNTENSIFEIINHILNLELKEAITKLSNLSWFLDNPYLLYNMLVSNFRLYFYIFKLKNLNYNTNNIKEILNLWNRWFLVEKNYKISFKKFNLFYEKLISIDSNMKTWKLLWNNNDEFLYELEKTIFYTK